MSSPISGQMVTSVLPKSQSPPSGNAAVWIAFRDTRDAHAREKIDSLFLDLSRWILRDIDLCTRGHRVGTRRAWLSGTVHHLRQENRQSRLPEVGAQRPTTSN